MYKCVTVTSSEAKIRRERREDCTGRGLPRQGFARSSFGRTECTACTAGIAVRSAARGGRGRRGPRGAAVRNNICFYNLYIHIRTIIIIFVNFPESLETVLISRWKKKSLFNSYFILKKTVVAIEITSPSHRAHPCPAQGGERRRRLLIGGRGVGGGRGCLLRCGGARGGVTAVMRLAALCRGGGESGRMVFFLCFVCSIIFAKTVSYI